jgi:23S rRNA (cytidine1920-2'-O)/16S rRNA (cytidine1409-2'-O)-methyltransferase
MASARRRLDAELVRRGLVASRERAHSEIEAGRVTVGGAPATKAARLVAPGDAIVVLGPGPRFVSRGGDKLDAALDRFEIDVDGLRCLDVGASTGGFTDCLLQRGAREVVAVDVGYGQLHERLRADPRVRNVERTNIREVDRSHLGAPFDAAVADVSFISLTKVLDTILGACTADAPVVLLVKPQFEAGRAEAARGQGIITDPAIWQRVIEEVITAVEQRGAVIMGCMVSPLIGAEGNVEFLLAARTEGSHSFSDAPDLDLGPVLAEAIERQPY